MRNLVRGALVAAAVIATAVGTATALAAEGKGFRTSEKSMLTGVAPGSSVTPIITVGERVGSFRFESIPDGVSLYRTGEGRRGGGDSRREDDDDDDRRGRVDIFVNHETSTVPFPFAYPGSTTESAAQNDFDNAQVSRLTLGDSARVLGARFAIRSSEGYQRFCSNYLATEKEGFERPLLFTNEEAVDWVNRSGQAWPATEGAPGARQAGVVVAHDPRTGRSRPIWGMGRHNHENSVAVPGYREVVLLSGDDAFVNNPAQSQVYAYIARGANAVWEDRGDLWAFVSDDPTVDDYYDFPVGNMAKSVSGRFVKVPKDVATGRKPDGTDLVAADKGYPAPPSEQPPTSPTWQRSIFPPPHGVDGPQWVLEHWGDTLQTAGQPTPVFQFLRIEDIAYDKRRGMSNVIYLADSGRGATSAGGNPFTSSNGRIWKMVLDKKDPTKVTSLSVLVEGEDLPVKAPGEIHQPDNLETTAAGSLLVTEDPGSSQQFPVGSTDPAATTARIWHVDLKAATPDAAKSVAARVDQSADEGPTDVDGVLDPPTNAPGNLGAWEASGIVDASSVYGRGTFLVTVQAHTLWIEKQTVTGFSPLGLSFTNKREGGQLVLLRLPGA
jgi:hypothetical protein